MEGAMITHDYYNECDVDIFAIEAEMRTEAIVNETKAKAPCECRDCEHFCCMEEDNRFTAYGNSDSRKTFGSVEVLPWCKKLGEECPEDSGRCPLQNQDIEKADAGTPTSNQNNHCELLEAL
jgi:hypothetical protein